jgi:hypothetical protein
LTGTDLPAETLAKAEAGVAGMSTVFREKGRDYGDRD